MPKNVLLHKSHNKELSDALWGPYKSKGIVEYWEYVYFLDAWRIKHGDY